MDDLISRQAAIDVVEKYDFNFPEYMERFVTELRDAMKEDLKGDIADLPSAQPDIIRCKDCRWWDKSDDSPFGYCMAIKHGYMSEHWEIGIYRRYKGDFYCADAERRTYDRHRSTENKSNM